MYIMKLEQNIRNSSVALKKEPWSRACYEWSIKVQNYKKTSEFKNLFWYPKLIFYILHNSWIWKHLILLSFYHSITWQQLIPYVRVWKQFTHLFIFAHSGIWKQCICNIFGHSGIWKQFMSNIFAYSGNWKQIVSIFFHSFRNLEAICI